MENRWSSESKVELAQTLPSRERGRANAFLLKESGEMKKESGEMKKEKKFFPSRKKFLKKEKIFLEKE